MRSPLARLIRRLRLSRRQLSLPVKRLPPPARLSDAITSEELALLDADPALKATGAAARAKLEQMIDEGYLPPRKGRAKRSQSARLARSPAARRPRASRR